MKARNYLIIFVASAWLAGCAAKNYPIEPFMTVGEYENTTCRELYVKLMEMQGTKDAISDFAQKDYGPTGVIMRHRLVKWRAMVAKNDAEIALYEQIVAIRTAQMKKGCINPNARPESFVKDGVVYTLYVRAQ